jgi:hypothetical protein
MATYREKKGVYVLKVSADPSTLIEGMVWFNTTTGQLKLRKASTTVVISSS